jgi:hypothetical protein
VAIEADRDSEMLLMAGPESLLAILADILLALSEATPGYDIHLEWYPDHPYIAGHSVSLVATLEQ